jgi:Kdo2-lipid IVA lauroyltransferase/acyltransferase
MKKVKHIIEFIFVCLLFVIFFILPLRLSSWLGGLLARIIGPFSKSHNVAMCNLARCFPNNNTAQNQKIASSVWDNLGRMFAEYPKLSVFSKSFIQQNVELGHLHETLAPNKKCILVAGHYGNFELASPIADTLSVKINLVYRPATNPYTNWLISKMRLRNANSLIKKGVAGVKAMIAALNRNEALGLLIDQKMNEGESLKFFGFEAKSTNMHAKLALKCNAPIYLAFFQRVAGIKFKVYIKEVRFQNTDTPNEIAQRINDMLEEEIIKHPEQWFWVHRRWG